MLRPEKSQDYQDLYLGLIRMHILFDACEGPIFGLGMIGELRRHGSFTRSALRLNCQSTSTIWISQRGRYEMKFSTENLGGKDSDPPLLPPARALQGQGEVAHACQPKLFVLH